MDVTKTKAQSARIPPVRSQASFARRAEQAIRLMVRAVGTGYVLSMSASSMLAMIGLRA